ncbi:MAG: helix-turn-helix domain-containing protein [bacterium]|nr:helix-turn-helix domain-containing protein [bacterium]
MKELERALKAFANGRRLAIVKYLKWRSKATVGEIARAIRLSFKSTSRHLTLLAFAEVVERNQVNIQAWYSLKKKQSLAARSIINIL